MHNPHHDRSTTSPKVRFTVFSDDESDDTHSTASTQPMQNRAVVSSLTSPINTPLLNTQITHSARSQLQPVLYQPVIKKKSSLKPSLLKPSSSKSAKSDSEISSILKNRDDIRKQNIADRSSSHGGHAASITTPPISNNIEESKNSDSDDDSSIKLQSLINEGKVFKVKANKYEEIPINTYVCYSTEAGKVIFNKYLKYVDSNTVIFGFSSKPNRKEYPIDIDYITAIYTYGYVKSENEYDSTSGGKVDTAKYIVKRTKNGDNLRNTIIIEKNDWESIQPGTTISYLNKTTNKYIYKAKFNSIILNSKNGQKSMSLTNKTGSRYFIKLENIQKMYRHILTIDLTILQLLKSINELTLRVEKLEKNR